MINDEFVAKLENTYGGKLHYFYQDLQTGETLSHCPDVKVSTASVIKLPMLVHVALAVEAGKADWSELLTFQEEEKVRGTGILFGLTPGVKLSLRDICYLMMVLSDNTATNMVIDRFGREAINARIHELGLHHTTLFRKAFMPDTPESKEFGLGVSTARETADLLTRLAHKQIGNEQTADLLLDILAAQQDHAAIPRYLPQGWRYAGKTGSINYLRADAGIVTAPDGRQYILAIFCNELPAINWTVDNPGLLAIAHLARELLASEMSK